MANDDKISETDAKEINGSEDPEKVVGEMEPVIKEEPVKNSEPVKDSEPVKKVEAAVEANGGPNTPLSLSEREEFLVMKAVLGSREGKALYLDYLEREQGRSERRGDN